MQEPTPLDPVPAGSRDALIDEAHVQLSVSFPTITLSVADASALRAGHVIDLGVSLANAQMTVKLADADIGKGRLMVAGTHAVVMLMSMGG